MVRDQWVNLARMPGLHLYSFSKDILGFLMTTESQDLNVLTSHPKDGCSQVSTCISVSQMVFLKYIKRKKRHTLVSSNIQLKHKLCIAGQILWSWKKFMKHV